MRKMINYEKNDEFANFARKIDYTYKFLKAIKISFVDSKRII